MTEPRPRPRDDYELEQMTGIRPADHQWVSSATVEKAERQMLGYHWYRRRPKAEEEDK